MRSKSVVAVHRHRAQLVTMACLVALVAVLFPVADHYLYVMPGLVPATAVVVLVCNLFTATLLVALYRSGRSSRLLLLAMAFGWSASTVLVGLFAVPGVMLTDPLLSVESGAFGWLWLSRHVGPPVLIGLALLPWPSRPDRAAGRRVPRRLIALGWVVSILGGSVGLAAVTLVAPRALPVILNPFTWELSAPVLVVALVAPLLCVTAAGVSCVRRHDVSSVEGWAFVAVVAWAGDATFVTMGGGPGTVAYYGARVLSMVAAVLVLAVLLHESWRVHQRVMAGTDDLRARIARLEEDALVRNHVAAVVSHDIRTPLAGLHGYLEVLVDDDGLTPDLVRRMHERSLVLTRRLTLLAEDLLAATTTGQAELVLAATDLDLDRQLAETATAFPDLDLRISCSRDTRVHADPLRLQQVLTNLVGNAQKHGVEPVTVEAVQDAGRVIVRVRDKGAGVPEEFIPHLFEPYAQGPQAAGGAGIGLAVVHDLVDAHGGTVRYDRADPSFVVTLPSGAPAPAPDPGLVPVASPEPRLTTPAC